MTISLPGLLNPVGPAQSEYLIHFCGRPAGRSNTPTVPAGIRALTAEQRLDAILWEQKILGFAPFGTDVVQPMVCLSESPPSHLEWLLQGQHWPPWGVIFQRNWVYAHGGGPVWYARPEEYFRLPPEQRAWAVRYEATAGSRSDWAHEREWRIPVPPADPALRLVPGDIVAVLIGDPMWQPAVRYWPPAEPGIAPAAAIHPLWHSVQRWFWDSARRSFMSWPAGVTASPWGR
jgi:hypothetical protein